VRLVAVPDVVIAQGGLVNVERRRAAAALAALAAPSALAALLVPALALVVAARRGCGYCVLLVARGTLCSGGGDGGDCGRVVVLRLMHGDQIVRFLGDSTHVCVVVAGQQDSNLPWEAL
jgi:hypothetical protein